MSKIFFSIDQSLSKSAVCIWKEGKPTDFKVIKGIKGTEEDKHKQMVKEISKLIYNDGTLVVEGLPLGNVSTAVRSLAGLYFTLSYLYEDFHAIKPTTIKKYAVAGNAKKIELYLALPDDIKLKFRNYMLESESNKVQDNMTERLERVDWLYKQFSGREKLLRGSSNKGLSPSEIELKKEFLAIDRYFSTKVLLDLTDSYWLGMAYINEKGE